MALSAPIRKRRRQAAHRAAAPAAPPRAAGAMLCNLLQDHLGLGDYGELLTARREAAAWELLHGRPGGHDGAPGHAQRLRQALYARCPAQRRHGCGWCRCRRGSARCLPHAMSKRIESLNRMQAVVRRERGGGVCVAGGGEYHLPSSAGDSATRRPAPRHQLCFLSADPGVMSHRAFMQAVQVRSRLQQAAQSSRLLTNAGGRGGRAPRCRCMHAVPHIRVHFKRIGVAKN